MFTISWSCLPIYGSRPSKNLAYPKSNRVVLTECRLSRHCSPSTSHLALLTRGYSPNARQLTPLGQNSLFTSRLLTLLFTIDYLPASCCRLIDTQAVEPGKHKDPPSEAPTCQYPRVQVEVDAAILLMTVSGNPINQSAWDPSCLLPASLLGSFQPLGKCQKKLASVLH